MSTTDPPVPNQVQFNLLTEPLIGYRRPGDGAHSHASLPQLLAALARDEVRDFPALRAHQRHPWHAFLCQLAAITLHRAGVDLPWTDDASWRDALRALTPDHPDDAPWCLVSPPDRPALLQAPTKADVRTWKSVTRTPDELDILITSKNHELKSSRAADAEAQDWLFALVSLQTQAGYSGPTLYGISRMNGGSSSRCGVGLRAGRSLGVRWSIDVSAALKHRDAIAETYGLPNETGQALLWLPEWDGLTSLAFRALDPLYIEICRQVRLSSAQGRLHAFSTGSKVTRIDAESLKGRTGDPWASIDVVEGKSLTLSRQGFDYRLASDLLFAKRFAGGCAQDLAHQPIGQPLHLSMRGLVRGQGKTEGFHERLVPIAPRVRSLLVGGQRDSLARTARERIDAIAEIRKLLWGALVALFNNGKPGSDASDGVKERAGQFARALEWAEDARFFDDLDREIHAEGAEAEIAARRDWLIGLAARAEALLRDAFVAGPRSAMQRYRAQSAALSRWHGGLRSPKAPASLMVLSNHLRLETELRKEKNHAA